MNSTYGGGKGRRRQSKDHNPRVAPVVDDPDLHSSYSAHHPHSYTPPQNMRRDSSQTRNRHVEVDNWQQRGETSHSTHDTRYNNDNQRRDRSSREIYERPEVESWQPRLPANDIYSHPPSREWVDEYPQSFPSSSYNEPAVYPPVHSNRASGYEWGAPEEDIRIPENGHRYVEEPPVRPWGREIPPPRDPNVTQPRFVSDSGWDTRFVETREPARGYVEDTRAADDARKWEPAPSWNQTASRPSTSRNQRNQQYTTNNYNNNNGTTQNSQIHNNNNNRNQKNGKGGKKQWNKNNKNNDNKQRDWKADDSHLNNWTKRDNQAVPASVNSIPLKRRQPRSPQSHSRSRSPAASYYSRRSGRSGSRSPSPKRMRQSPSPVRQTSSPVRQKRQKANRSKRRQRNSPQAARDRGRPRQRTASPPSRSSRSVSSVSSRSSKGGDRPRTVHRLPTATSIKDIDISLSMSKATVTHPPRKKVSRIPQPSSPQWANHAPTYSRHEDDANSSSMPPPPVPHSASMSNRELDNESYGPLPPASAKARPKNAGFRPIGNTSSSLRKFFPGDDDDEPPHFNDPPMPVSNAVYPETTYRESAYREPAYHEAPYREPVYPDSASQHIEDSTAAEFAEYAKLRSAPVPTTPEQAMSRRTSFHEEHPVEHQSGQDERPTKPTNGHHHHEDVPPNDFPDSGARRNELYSIVSQVGEGTFGKVYKARNTSTGLFVALKRVRMEAERDGFPVTAMREIKLLQSLQHPNVICLYEMMVSNGSVYMVFEYMDHDLTGILSQTQFSFTDAQLKSLCHQMLAGLAYLHHKGVIHRDIKGSNILVNNRGELKLADFGLARFYQKRRQCDYTNRVITLWYRPPELLFGTTVYGPEVDIWSAGCIMLELFTKRPVFQGNDEIHQLDVMYKVLGTPNSARWPGVTGMPWYELIKPREDIPSPFKDLFKKWLSPCGLQLAEQLLDYDPSRRITAAQALQHPYFNQEEPPPEIPVGLATLEGEWHELETKREKARKRKKEA